MNNTLFLFVGASGSGKSTVAKSVLSNKVISHTSREIRTVEKNHEDYHFVEISEFVDLLESGKFIDHTNYSGNYYGMTYDELDNALKKGNAYVVVDIWGMKRLKEIYPDSVSIFVKTTREDARRSMIKRGDSLQKIEDRIRTFAPEQENASQCDYTVTNKFGELNKTLAVVRSIISTHTVINLITTPMEIDWSKIGTGGIVNPNLMPHITCTKGTYASLHPNECVWKGEYTMQNDDIKAVDMDIEKISAQIIKEIKKNNGGKP